MSATATATRIRFPYGFGPREYQLPTLVEMETKKRGILRWHRRAGKDKVCWNYLINMTQKRVGVYWYMFPDASLGRKIIWEGIDKQGFRTLDHIPGPAIRSMDKARMHIELTNGSSIWILGADTMINVGPNPIGIVYSEFALQKPSCWDLCRPILAENGGWALFNWTPRGQNHAYDLEMKNLDNPKWWISSLTVDDTHAIPLEAIQDDRDSGMDEDTIQQEYWVSYAAAIKGAYYGQQMADAEAQGRIGAVPWERNLPVDTAWDLGMDDSMTIWFLQPVSPVEIRVLGYMEGSGEGIDFYIHKLREKPYVWGTHYAPHDIEVRELCARGRSRRDYAKQLGVDFVTVPRGEIMDGIAAVRALLPRLWFDKAGCGIGVNALRSYQKEWDKTKKIYAARPRHDWSSHASDALRCYAMGAKVKLGKVSSHVVQPAPAIPLSAQWMRG